MTHRPQAGPIITSTGDAWEKYLGYGIKRKYPANCTLLHPGAVPDTLYYIQSGEVLISNYAAPETISRLFILRSKCVLGLIGMFTPNTSMVSWVTLEPCVCYLFNRKDIYETIPRELLLSMLEQMGAMSSSMTRRFAQSSGRRLDVRLARMIIHLVDACPKSDPQPPGGLAIVPRVTQEMLSELLGMHPVTLNRVIALLRRKGIIGRFTKNRLEILDFATLKECADCLS